MRETGAEITRVNGHLELSTRDLEQLNAVVDRVRVRGVLLSELAPIRASLEDVFVGLVRSPGVESADAKPEGETK
jgi:hypothetical protein